MCWISVQVPCYLHGAGSEEEEELGHQVSPLWDARITGSSFTGYATTLALVVALIQANPGVSSRIRELVDVLSFFQATLHPNSIPRHANSTLPFSQDAPKPFAQRSSLAPNPTQLHLHIQLGHLSLPKKGPTSLEYEVYSSSCGVAHVRV